MNHYLKSLRKIKNNIFILLSLLVFSCAVNEEDENIVYLSYDNKPISGQKLLIDYDNNNIYKFLEVNLLENNNLVESYGKQKIQKFSGTYTINRFLNKDLFVYSNYSLEFVFSNNNKITSFRNRLQIEKSVIVKSFCSTENCEVLTGNIVQNTINKVKIRTYKIAATKIEYVLATPYDIFKTVHEFTSPVNEDYLDNIILRSVKDEYSSYISSLTIRAYDNEGNVAETSLPFKVVRPIEIKHFGKYELAETYEPVPVTGCIPGSVGNNVQYSESESETRQNSVSITLSNSWSGSDSITSSNSQSEGISVGQTSNTVLSSSLSESETQSESYENSYSEGSSSNINFSSSDGENWSWNINDTESQSNTNSNSNTSSAGVNGSVTTGFSGEGSLPFLAKASGKVEVTAGISLQNSNTNSESQTDSSSNSRGYSTGGSTQNQKTFGSSSSEARSHSLSGSYVLSNSTTSTISESSGLSSGRVWNMSESISSGKTVTEGNSESLSETIVNSSSSSTTFSYSAYIPRGRFGIFYRQTSRYVKISEVITYDLNGFPRHSGFILMNSWAWAPELSIGESCSEMPGPSLPEAVCHIPPCGE